MGNATSTGIVYTDDGKFAYFGGLKFTRDDKTGYYLNSIIRKRLHRAVWEHFRGEIPKGYHIHHVDHDKSNNEIDNLALLKGTKHASLHGILDSMDQEWLQWSRDNLAENARPKASEWHRSEEGRRWHKEHYEQNKDKLHRRFKKQCEHCGDEYDASNNGMSRFCSNKCKSAWRRKSGVDDVVRVCAYCKREFKANKYEKRECCSRSCSNRLKPRLPQLRESEGS